MLENPLPGAGDPTEAWFGTQMGPALSRSYGVAYLQNNEKLDFENFSGRNFHSYGSNEVTRGTPIRESDFQTSPPYRYAPPYG